MVLLTASTQGIKVRGPHNPTDTHVHETSQFRGWMSQTSDLLDIIGQIGSILVRNFSLTSMLLRSDDHVCGAACADVRT
jgi:hypothetical protein